MSRLKGYIFNNAGTPVEGATVTALEAGTTTAIGSTVESGSDGSWSFTSGLTGKNVDVKIESGSTVRYLKHDDHVQVEHMWVRSDTGNTVAPMRIENATNNASNLLLELVGDNSTRADGDEIYISFKMDDDGGNEHEFARITADATDVSNGNEDGQLRFGVSVAGTMTDVFTINATTAGVSDMTLDVSGDLTLDADGGDVFFKDAGTTYGSATNNSGNLIIKSGTTTALTFTGADVAVAGDLTISGDDLKMATNTDTYILVADGTSYNPVAVSGDVTISNTGAVTIASDAVESGMLNDDVISGQTEITSGLVAADEFLYSDGGTLKRVGIDTLATKMLGLASAGTVAQASDHMVFLDGGATGDVIVESIGDFLSAIAGSGISVSSNQLTASSSDTVDMGDGFVIEDGDGTEVTITENKEVKFVEGAGIDIDWTDVDNGTDGDPYDLTFTVDHDAASNFVAAEHYDWSTDISGTATIHANNVTDLHGAGVSGSNNQLLTDDGDGTVTSESNLTFDGSTLTVSGDVTLSDDKSITLGDEGQIIFNDVAPSTDHSATGIVIKGTLASGVTAGMVLYLKSDGTYDHADKDAESTMPAVGVALEDAGSDKKILIYGVYVDASLSLTQGEELYVSDDGAVTHTVPGSGDFLQRVGVALTTTSVLFMPSLDVIEHA